MVRAIRSDGRHSPLGPRGLTSPHVVHLVGSGMPHAHSRRLDWRTGQGFDARHSPAILTGVHTHRQDGTSGRIRSAGRGTPRASYRTPKVHRPASSRRYSASANSGRRFSRRWRSRRRRPAKRAASLILLGRPSIETAPASGGGATAARRPPRTDDPGPLGPWPRRRRPPRGSAGSGTHQASEASSGGGRSDISPGCRGRFRHFGAGGFRPPWKAHRRSSGSSSAGLAQPRPSTPEQNRYLRPRTLSTPEPVHRRFAYASPDAPHWPAAGGRGSVLRASG